MSTERENCSICQNINGDNSVKLSCNHEFHPNCIVEYLRRDNRCPVCRDTGGNDVIRNNWDNGLGSYRRANRFTIYSTRDLNAVTKGNKELEKLKSKYMKTKKQYAEKRKIARELLKKLKQIEDYKKYIRNKGLCYSLSCKERRELSNWRSKAIGILYRKELEEMFKNIPPEYVNTELYELRDFEFSGYRRF